MEDSLVLTESEATGLAHKIQRADKVGFDTESSGPIRYFDEGDKYKMLNMYRSTPTGFSVAFDDNTRYYIPTGHYSGNTCLRYIIPVLKSLCEPKEVWAHNWKHDLFVLDQYCKSVRIDRPNVSMFDSMLLAYVYGEAPLGLKELSKRFLDANPMEFREATGGRSFMDMNPKDLKTLLYACDDATNTLKLGDLWEHNDAFRIEMEVMPIFYSMCNKGMGIDVDKLLGLGHGYMKRLSKIHELWNMLAPTILQKEYKKKDNIYGPLNINSPTQLQHLYDEGIWPTQDVEENKSGYSTNAYSLQQVLNNSEKGSLGWKLAKTKQKYQEIAILASTFTFSLVDHSYETPDGRVHPDYRQTGTVTGRAACKNPNLQNIPASGEGLNVKECFIPAKGYSYVSADYSQLELRVLAHFIGSGVLYEGYREGADVHQKTADAVGLSRVDGKTLNFAIIYGSGPPTVSKNIGCSIAKAKRIMSKHQKGMPEVPEYIQKIHKRAASGGELTTISGRVRHFEEMFSGRSKRQAFNHVIQGSASDLVKMAMVSAGEDLIAQVHDELCLEVPDKGAIVESRRLSKVMEDVATQVGLRVPLVAEAKVVKNWANAK